MLAFKIYQAAKSNLGFLIDLTTEPFMNLTGEKVLKQQNCFHWRVIFYPFQILKQIRLLQNRKNFYSNYIKTTGLTSVIKNLTIDCLSTSVSKTKAAVAYNVSTNTTIVSTKRTATILSTSSL